MNVSEQINNEYIKQQQIINDFKSRKTIEEQEEIKSLINRFLNKEGINKEEFLQLINYFTGKDASEYIDTNDNIFKYGKRYNSFNVQFLNDKLIKCCLILS